MFLLCFSLAPQAEFHLIEMNDRTPLNSAPPASKFLREIPDLSTVSPCSLLSRMVRWNPILREGQGERPRADLDSLRQSRQSSGRQMPVPRDLKKEAEESQRAFAHMQKVLKQ